MKRVLIKLLQDWERDGKKFATDQVLEVDEDEAEGLIEAKIAELREKVDPPADPPKDDSPADDPSKDEPTVSVEDIGKIVRTELEAHRKLVMRKPPAVPKNELDKTGGYFCFADFAKDVQIAGVPGKEMPERLVKWTNAAKVAGHMQEADDAQGGHLVPTQFQATLLQTMIERATIRPRCTFVPMQTNRIAIPMINDTTHAGGSTHGGVVVYWPDEAGAKNPSKPAIGKVELSLHKMIGLVYVSDELMEDSPISIEPMLTTMFSDAMTFAEENRFMSGTGAGVPLGILNSPCLVTQAAEVGQAANTIVYPNVTKMWSRLHATAKANSAWWISGECFPQIAQMSVPVGTGGSAVYVPSDGAAGRPYGTLFGRPVIETEHCQALGTTGDIVLADFSKYLIGGKAGQVGPKIDSSIHVNFIYDERAFRFVFRLDGQPWWQSDLTTKHGGATATQSPFVVLATRP